jgi:hypothetical protein
VLGCLWRTLTRRAAAGQGRSMATTAHRPLDLRRPFTRAQALDAGIDPRRLRSREFRRVLRNAYVAASVPDSPLLRAQAALCLVPGSAWASHATAGRVHRVPLPALPEEHVSVLAAGDRRVTEGLRSHVGAASSPIVVIEGVRVSSPAQTFVELAGLLTLVDLVVVGDDLVRRRLLTPAGLLAFCCASEHRHAGAASRAAAYVRERVDSPMETRLRMLLVLAGLPEPEVNLTVRDVDGTPLRRYDLCWPGVRVVVEYDGRHHVERESSWEADLERRERIDDDGWRILVVVARGIHREPGRTVDRVWRLLRARRLPGVPVRPSDAWRPHFPER